MEGLRKYCMVREMSKVIERARNPTEAWLLLESHFDRQMAFINGLVSQLLDSERAVNDAQILTYYNKVLRAIREAKELERLQDFLTPNQIETLEQMDVPAEDMPVAFYVFARRRAQELCSNAAAAKILREAPSARSVVWEGPCELGDLCGKSHMLEACSMFEELAPRDRLAVIQRKQLCHFCFRHPDSQPCPSHLLLACPIRWSKTARRITTVPGKIALVRENGQVVMEDGLRVWEVPSRVGEVELPVAGRGPAVHLSTKSRTSSGENADLVRLLQLCSGGVCCECCFYSYTAKSSHHPMVAFTPKRRAVSRGEYNSKIIGEMSCN